MGKKKKHAILFCVAVLVVIAVSVAAAMGEKVHGDIIHTADYKSTEDKNKSFVVTFDGVKVIVSDSDYIDYSEGEWIVNINTANQYELSKVLPQIGDKRAAAIIEYRNIAGEFKSVEELCEVRGIGENTLKIIRRYCTISGPSVQRFDAEDEADSEKE